MIDRARRLGNRGELAVPRGVDDLHGYADLDKYHLHPMSSSLVEGFAGSVNSSIANSSSAMLVLPLVFGTLVSEIIAQTVPEQALLIDQRGFNVLENVLPPSEFNLTNVSACQ